MERNHKFNGDRRKTKSFSIFRKWLKSNFPTLSTTSQSKKHVTFSNAVVERHELSESQSEESNDSNEPHELSDINKLNESNKLKSYDSINLGDIDNQKVCGSKAGTPLAKSEENSSTPEERRILNQEKNDEAHSSSFIEAHTTHAHQGSSHSQQSESSSSECQERRVSFAPYVCKRVISPFHGRHHRQRHQTNRRIHMLPEQQVEEIVQYLLNIPNLLSIMNSSPARKYSCGMQPVRAVSSSTTSRKDRGHVDRSKSWNRRRPPTKTQNHSHDSLTSSRNQSPENECIHNSKRRTKGSEQNIASRSYSQRSKYKLPTKSQNDKSSKYNESFSIKNGSGLNTSTQKVSSLNPPGRENELATNIECQSSQESQEMPPAKNTLLAPVHKVRVSTKKRNTVKVVSNGDVEVQDAEQTENLSQYSVVLNPYIHWKKMPQKCVKEVKRKDTKCTLTILFEELSKQKKIQKMKRTEKDSEKDKEKENDESNDQSEEVQIVNFGEKVVKKAKMESQAIYSPLRKKRKMEGKSPMNMNLMELITALTNTSSKIKTNINSNNESEDTQVDISETFKKTSTEHKTKRKTETLQSKSSEIINHKSTKPKDTSGTCGSRRSKGTKKQVYNHKTDELYESNVKELSWSKLVEKLKENLNRCRANMTNKGSAVSVPNSCHKLRRRTSEDNISQTHSNNAGNLYRKSVHGNVGVKIVRQKVSKNELKEKNSRRGTRLVKGEELNTWEGRKLEKQSTPVKPIQRSRSIARQAHNQTTSTHRSKSQILIGEKGKKEVKHSQTLLRPTPKSKLPPKGFLTFEQVVGATTPKMTKRLSWETLVNARDENGVSPVGLLRLKARRRRRRPKKRSQDTRDNSRRKDNHVVPRQRKRSATVADAMEVSERRLALQRTLDMLALRSSSPPSRRQKRWDLAIPAYFYDQDYYHSLKGVADEAWLAANEDIIPHKRIRLDPSSENSSTTEQISKYFYRFRP